MDNENKWILYGFQVQKLSINLYCSMIVVVQSIELGNLRWQKLKLKLELFPNSFHLFIRNDIVYCLLISLWARWWANFACKSKKMHANFLRRRSYELWCYRVLKMISIEILYWISKVVGILCCVRACGVFMWIAKLIDLNLAIQVGFGIP